MKKLLLIALATTPVLMQSCKKEEPSDLKEQLSLTGNNKPKAESVKKYDYVLIEGVGTDEPLAKECKTPNGNKCKKKAKGVFTQYEWDIFFPNTSKEDLLNTNVNQNAAWVRYQEQIGFGY